MSKPVFKPRMVDDPWGDEYLRCDELRNARNFKARDTRWPGAPTPYESYPQKAKLSTGERRCLYMMSHCGGNIAELGTHLGGGAAVIGHGMVDGGKGGKLFVVDNFGEEVGRSDARVNIGEYNTVNRLTNYFKNLPSVELVICKGDTSSWGYKMTCKFDLVFLDADHSYAGCKREYEAWSPLIKEGGLIVYHDSDLIGVHRVIEEMKGFKLEEHVWAMKVFRKCTQ